MASSPTRPSMAHNEPMMPKQESVQWAHNCPNLSGDPFADRAHRRTHYGLVGIRSEVRDCEGTLARNREAHAKAREVQIVRHKWVTIALLLDVTACAPEKEA